MARTAAAGAPIVVFHQEDKRQLPQFGHIQRLVENSFLHGAVAKENQRDRTGFLHLRGESGSGGKRETAANDCRCVNDSELGSGHVKGPGPPAAVPGFAPDNLGQHFPRIAAFGDDMAVISVRAENIVPRRQGFADGNTRGLLSDVNVKVAADETFVLLVETDDVLLGTPYHQHLAQDAKLLFSRKVGQHFFPPEIYLGQNNKKPRQVDKRNLLRDGWSCKGGRLAV